MESHPRVRGQERYDMSYTALQNYENQLGPNFSVTGERFGSNSGRSYNQRASHVAFSQSKPQEFSFTDHRTQTRDSRMHNTSASFYKSKPERPSTQQLRSSTKVYKAPARDRKLEGYSQYSKQVQPRTEMTPPDQGLENEYITNLQQQVYFLELEIKMQKDKEKERMSKMMGGIEAGPLTENMWALKSKYSKIQKELEEKIQALDEENRDLGSRNQSLKSTYEKAMGEVSQIESDLKTQTKEFDEESEKYRKAISYMLYEKEDYSKKLAEATKERDLCKTYAGETKIKIDRINNQIQNLEERLAQMETEKNQELENQNNKMIEMQEKYIQLQEDLKNQTTLQVRHEKLNTLTQQKQEVELERDNLLNKIKSLEYSIDLVEKSSTQINSEKRELQNELDDLNLELEKERTHQETLLAARLKQREKKELAVAYQQVEDARRDAHFHMQALKQKISENNNLVDQKNKFTFDIAEVKTKMER